MTKPLRIALLAAHASRQQGPVAPLWNHPGVDLERFYQESTLVKALALEHYDLVVVEMPCHRQGQALDLLKTLRAMPGAPNMLCLTEDDTLAEAMACAKQVPWHLPHTGPQSTEQLLDVLKEHASGPQGASLAKETHALFARHYASEDFVVQSPKMLSLLELARRAALGPSTVLITGESGTGKEKLARFIHSHSRRAGSPFVAINCAAISSGVLESELFGHVRGAFTGAERDTPGVFRQAHQGTLFLDEVGEVDLAFQTKLLRVLQEGEVQPVGSGKRVPVDVRIIAATNRSLKQDEGFRDDLYFRLAVIPLTLPPLRHRQEEIMSLVALFIKKMNTRLRRNIQGISPQVESFLMQYHWPGNVRELENLIERGCALEPSNRLELASLQLDQLSELSPPSSPSGTLESVIEDATIRCIEGALSKHQGKRVDAAKELGIERTTLYRLMKKHQIDTSY